MVFEEPAHVASHIIFRAPRLRDQHQHGVFRGTPRGDEQFEHIVERGGIALAGLDQGEELREVVAEQLALQKMFARPHGIQVAAQGVDLAVVRQVAERMRQLPRRERVRAVALVHDREARTE